MALLGLLALAVAAWLARPAWVAVRTTALLPELSPTAPAHPLLGWTDTPRMEPVRFALGDEMIDADLYLPAGGGQHPGLVIQQGAATVGRRYPTLVHLAESFARTGVATIVPDSPDLLAGRVTPRDVERLEAAIRYLQGRKEVDPRRMALFGFSVGGSLALIATTDGHAGAGLRFVATSGQYFSLPHMVQVATTGSYQAPDGLHRFPTAPWVWLVVRNTAISALPDPEDRQRLAAAFATERPAPPLASRDGLTSAGRAVYAALANRDPGRAEALYQQLPPAVRWWLDSLSPAAHTSSMHLPVLVMVDEDDAYIPAQESRELAQALGGHASLTVMNILHHVELATKPQVNVQSLVGFYIPEFWKLWWYAFRMLDGLS